MEYLVIDVGGTAIKYACMNENAEFLERGEIPTPMDSLDRYLAALGTIIHRFDHNVEGIAMCVTGISARVQGVCITGGNLRYVKGLPLATLLEERYGLRVSLENDARSPYRSSRDRKSTRLNSSHSTSSRMPSSA